MGNSVSTKEELKWGKWRLKYEHMRLEKKRYIREIEKREQIRELQRAIEKRLFK